MSLAICPGSFDPVTLGHIDIIKRASAMFDEVIVVVLGNVSKSTTFSIEERADFLRRSTAGMENVSVDIYEGLLADYTLLKKATAVVKGLRAMSDFEYEFQMALTNKSLNPGAETVFLPANRDYMFLSSSVIRQLAKHGRDVSAFVPAEIAGDIRGKLFGKGGKL